MIICNEQEIPEEKIIHEILYCMKFYINLFDNLHLHWVLNQLIKSNYTDYWYKLKYEYCLEFNHSD